MICIFVIGFSQVPALLEGCVEERDPSSSEGEGSSDSSDDEDAPTEDGQSQGPPMDKKVSALFVIFVDLFSK